MECVVWLKPWCQFIIQTGRSSRLSWNICFPRGMEGSLEKAWEEGVRKIGLDQKVHGIPNPHKFHPKNDSDWDLNQTAGDIHKNCIRKLFFGTLRGSEETETPWQAVWREEGAKLFMKDCVKWLPNGWIQIQQGKEAGCCLTGFLLGSWHLLSERNSRTEEKWRGWLFPKWCL